MDLKKDRCRSCKTGSSDIYYQSVSDNGFYSLTFKEMFEQSIGYPILEHEPQEFCNCCAERLVEWYEFKDLCLRTQETLVAIKTEPDVEQEELASVKEEELEDVKPDMSIFVESPRITEGNHIEALPINSLIKSECNDDSDEHENPSPLQLIIVRNEKVKITFEIHVRSYRDVQKDERSGVEVTSITTPLQNSMHFFRTQLWTRTKKHLIREVLFTTEGEPFWSKKPFPPTKDLSRFVEIFYENSNFPLDAIELSHLYLWNEKRVTLYIYPYSTSIKTKEQWIKVTKNLLVCKIQPDPKKQKTWQETEKWEITTEVTPSTSTNITVQKIKNDQKSERKVIWYKVKNNQLEVVCKRPLTLREQDDSQDHSGQHPSLEDHRYTSTSLRSQCCTLRESVEEEDTSERPSKVRKLEQEATEDYGSIFEEEYDVLEIKNEVEYIEVEKI